MKAIFTKKFRENDFTEFFFIFTGTWCKSALNGGSDGGTMRFKPECDHGGNAGKIFFAKKNKNEIVLLNLKYFQKFQVLELLEIFWNQSRKNIQTLPMLICIFWPELLL